MSTPDSVEIQTEFTPNPHSLKFNVNRPLLEKGSFFFENPASAEGVSPLASELLALPNVESVLIGQNFVTVTRPESVETWASIIPPVTKALKSGLDSGDPVILPEAAAKSRDAQPKNEVEEKIVKVLETYIRPSIARDGGDIVFHGFQDGVVTLYLQGACSTCPSSVATLKQGVERMLREYVPEVKEVVQYS